MLLDVILELCEGGGWFYCNLVFVVQRILILMPLEG